MFYWVINSGDVLVDGIKNKKKKTLTAAHKNVVSIWSGMGALEKYICNLKKNLYDKWAGKSHLNALWGESEQPSSWLSSLQ